MDLNLLVEKYKQGLYNPSGIDYEYYIVQGLNNFGYHAHNTKSSGDQGADIIINLNSSFKIAIQCKYYSKNVDNTPVQEILGALNYYKAQLGVVVTNRNYTPGAKNLASVNNIVLIPRFDFGDDILRIIKSLGIYPEKYIIEMHKHIEELQLQLNSIEAENRELIQYVNYLCEN